MIGIVVAIVLVSVDHLYLSDLDDFLRPIIELWPFSEYPVVFIAEVALSSVVSYYYRGRDSSPRLAFLQCYVDHSIQIMLATFENLVGPNDSTEV